MRLPKSSHTGDPLAVVLIWYPGKATCPPKTPGNLNGTYNMPKQYSRSTNNRGTSKKDRVAWCKPLCFRATSLCSFQDYVVQTFVFSSRSSCAKNMLSSSNSSPSHPGPLDSQRFHRVFPAALPRRQRNILYASVLQQPPLVTQLERQSSYEEDESI